MAETITLNVNGTDRAVKASPDRMLLWVLRDELGLTGSKYGCGEGQCGACTVLVDGSPRRSCITRLSSVAGKRLTTIEGLAQNGELHPLQQAFIDEDALQCGYCTPGMIVAGAGLLMKKPDPTVDEILDSMQGNVCRCGTYNRIVKAIQRAAKAMKEARP
ncbi:MAG: 2Fe-2S iron-sulfur cluster binding domain-containing protein [bacterium]|nr:2Fe-2S iron-sulfur cluster binding domain-containing protein [bacterium]